MSCPNCGSERVKWRSGVHFDNEMICYQCWLTWEPGRADQAIAERRKVEKDVEKKVAKKRQDDIDDSLLSGMGMDAPV